MAAPEETPHLWRSTLGGSRSEPCYLNPWQVRHPFGGRCCGVRGVQKHLRSQGARAPKKNFCGYSGYSACLPACFPDLTCLRTRKVQDTYLNKLWWPPNEGDVPFEGKRSQAMPLCPHRASPTIRRAQRMSARALPPSPRPSDPPLAPPPPPFESGPWPACPLVAWEGDRLGGGKRGREDPPPQWGGVILEEFAPA